MLIFWDRREDNRVGRGGGGGAGGRSRFNSALPVDGGMLGIGVDVAKPMSFSELANGEDCFPCRSAAYDGEEVVHSSHILTISARDRPGLIEWLASSLEAGARL